MNHSPIRRKLSPAFLGGKVASAGTATAATTAAITATLIAAAALTMLAPGTAQASATTFARVAGIEYFTLTNGPDIYAVQDYGTSRAVTQKLTFNEWNSAGQPKPRLITPAYVKYAWSDDIYSVVFFGTNQDAWVWDQVSLDEWRQAKYPAPARANWIAGTTFYRLASNKDEIFAKLNSTFHKLTYQEWGEAGHPAPQNFADQVAKLSWNDNIALFTGGLNGSSSYYPYDLWRKAGFPTPAIYSRLPGDTFARTCHSNDIYYFGPTWQGKLSFSQWQAAGAPRPQVQGTC